MQGIWNDVKIGGATIGAKTSVYSQEFWGQLVSNFTVALIKQVACTCHKVLVTIPDKDCTKNNGRTADVGLATISRFSATDR